MNNTILFEIILQIGDVSYHAVDWNVESVSERSAKILSQNMTSMTCIKNS